MTTIEFAAPRAAMRAHKPRRPKSVRPRLKDPEKNGSLSVPFFQPPAVGGETFTGPDYDAGRATRYAEEGHPLAPLVLLRVEAARHVEALLAFLDATEGDIEIADAAEPTLQMIREAATLCIDPTEDDEPSLGFLNPRTIGDEGYFPSTSWLLNQDLPQGDCQDCEGDEHDGREDGADNEPSLCGIGAHWVPNAAGMEDGEQEADDEWSLGSLTSSYGGGNQTRWAEGNGSDLEDSGLGNEDREEDGLSAGELDTGDDEPSLGWPERLVQGVDPGAGNDCEISPSLDVSDEDRRKFFRGRHGNVRAIPGATWAVT